MSSNAQAPTTIKRLWHKWKSLKLPWRRQFLVGADLAGNTFWEFKDALNANRFRRIVRYGSSTHYADVKISPQWHQWLRHTRPEPPTVREQQLDVIRQSQMKQLAAQADERWRSKESFLDAPNPSPAPALGVKDPGGDAPQTEPGHQQGVRNAVGEQEKVRETAEGQAVDEGRFRGQTQSNSKGQKQNPWTRAERGAPSENWQPQSWTPGSTKRS